jgi:hypothetical protein
MAAFQFRGNDRPIIVSTDAVLPDNNCSVYESVHGLRTGALNMTRIKQVDASGAHYAKHLFSFSLLVESVSV